MPLSKDTLLDLIEQGDVKACAEFFDGASEKERGKFAKVCAREYRTRWNQWEEPRPSPESVQAAKVATLATARLSDFKRLSGLIWLDEPEERELIAARPPELVQALAAWLVEDNPRAARFVLLMVREGLCEQPTHENFLLGLMERWGHTREEDGGLAGVLRSHPDFLQGDLWRLLATEGSGEFSLSAHDKYQADSGRWDVALVALSEEGLVPRARLLDATLDVLARDFAQFRASWYSRLHEALSPTTEERGERVQGYLRLLASTIPPTVSFALKALATLDKAGALDPEDLLAHVEPALLSRAKSSANLALRLVGSAASRSETPVRGARIAVRALAHEAADVQERALSLLVRLDALGDAHVQETIHDLREVAAPSTRRRLDEIAPLDGRGDGNRIAKPVTVEPVARTVEPVTHLDDLVLRFAHVLENPSAVEDVEQVLGGLALLCAERPSDWERRVGPLVKRAAVLRGSPEDTIQHDLACLALCWASEKRFDPAHLLRRDADKAPSTAHLFRERVRQLASRVRKRQAAPLLSCPTRPRGWIDPSEVVARVQRLRELKVKPDPADMVLALLRLATEGRAEALASADRVRGEFGEALRYALGSDRVRVGRSAHLWIAAARARNPRADHPLVARKHRNLGPDAVSAARCTLEIEEIGTEYRFFRLLIHREPKAPKRIPYLHPTVLFHAGRRGVRFMRESGACGFESSLVRWSALVSPGALEGYFSVGVERIDLDWVQAQWEVRSFFEPMLEPDVALGPMALLLLALGLGAKEPGQHGIAVDVLVTATDEARLDVDCLGDWMGKLLPSGLIKVRRWAQTLLQTAQAGAEPARVARTLIQSSLRGEPENAPRDLSYLLDALHELLIEAKEALSDSEARQYLERITTGGKTGRLRRALLAL